nr:penicillin-binding protein 2 [Streptomyces sp. CNQ085]
MSESPRRPRRARPASRSAAPRSAAASRSSRAPRPAARTPRPRAGTVGQGSHRPRLRLFGVLLTLVTLAFTVRLFQVQAVDASTYAAKADVNRYITVPLAAERGTVTDRDGVALATTVDAYDITADPYLFTPEQTKVPDAPARAAELLAPVLGVDEETLTERLSRKETRYVLLARQRPPQVWRQITDLKRVLAGRQRAGGGHHVLAGVYSEEHAKRVYPGGGLAAAVLGFVNSEGRGGGGLEAKFDKVLAGKDGKITYAQSGGRQVPTADEHEQPARPGSDVELTLDRDIQWAAQSAIEEQVERSDADGGYVIVQDVRTGEILALADAPGYDPGDLSTASASALRNGAVEDAYEPGSTSKLMSMAAVLEEGAATPGTHVVVPNRLPRADRSFADDVDHPTWYLTLNGVLAKSSNIGTILAVEQIGDTRAETNRVLHSYLRKFGLGQKTGLDFPGETPGILADPGDWNASQQYTIPFGQGVSINAVQAASVYSTVANKGVRVEPSLVRGTTGPGGEWKPAPEPERTRVVSEKTATTLATMLESVVEDMEGTGTTAQIPGYRVAGKTGTANRVDPETGRYNGYTSSFAGFAPADAPRVTVYCAVQNPKRGSYFGSDVCGPVYQQVMKYALKALRIPPTGSEPPRLPVTFDPRD